MWSRSSKPYLAQAARRRINPIWFELILPLAATALAILFWSGCLP